ncbi:hypothetical protein J6590_039611 [Homalodisca vitripennis]|nr:hypothetical protein J6590_039611 [Homalodisca vitripennis]
MLSFEAFLLLLADSSPTGVKLEWWTRGGRSSYFILNKLVLLFSLHLQSGGVARHDSSIDLRGQQELQARESGALLRN